jgi:alpha-glucoside transport system substrate-binding protein
MLALAACTQGGDTTGGGGGEDEEIGSVSVIGVWGGGEVESFQQVVSAWEDDTGGTMEFEGTRDLNAILRSRVEGGNPPDLAILPNPALMQELAAQGALQPLDEVIDIEGSYSDTWRELGSVDGQLYGMFVKAATKSTVWYDPQSFEDGGYEIPETWDDLVALTDEIKGAGGAAPWSVGVESGGASGWPGTDWIQEILLTESGPDVYDQWVDHEIPWTDPQVKSAWEKFGEIALGEGNVTGGASTIVSTNFEDASYLPFEDPPRAYLYFLGAFTQGFIEGQFPDLEAGADYDFFKFVEITEPGTATGGGDIIVMLNDTPSARSLMEYLSDGANWESWASSGGFATPNEGLDASVYPDDLARKAAQQLTETETFRFDADDLMPAEVQNAYFAGILEYLQSPDKLDSILANIESVAAGAYQ